VTGIHITYYQSMAYAPLRSCVRSMGSITIDTGGRGVRCRGLGGGTEGRVYRVEFSRQCHPQKSLFLEFEEL